MSLRALNLGSPSRSIVPYRVRVQASGTVVDLDGEVVSWTFLVKFFPDLSLDQLFSDEHHEVEDDAAANDQSDGQDPELPCHVDDHHCCHLQPSDNDSALLERVFQRKRCCFLDPWTLAPNHIPAYMIL